jgi:uncharacterized NAD(P)/FAD-binding protein YdhS
MSEQGHIFDIAFIGSGIASTATLAEVFRKLLNNGPAGNNLSIAIVEKNQEFWKGIPYGSRSSINALTITCVNDFIYEPERPAFFNWLKANQTIWATYYRENGGLTAERWLKNNLPLIDQNDWDTVYIPRFIFGIYLQEILLTLLKQIEEKQLAQITLIQAEAIDIDLEDGRLYSIELEHPDKSISHIASHKVVVATGSAPVRPVDELNPKQATYVNDIYEPSVNQNIQKLSSALSESSNVEDRNVLIIGSNASSIELLYLLEGMPDIRKLINQVTVVSPSGLLPYHISTEALDTHPIPNLEKLKSEGNYTIQTLVNTAALDLQLATKNGANVAYIATVISNTLKLMETLDESAKKEFFGIHGMRLSNLFRRSGPEYKAASQLLIDLQEVTFLKGKFINITVAHNGVILKYQETSSGVEKPHPSRFKVIINCSGSNNLDRSSSRLIYNMVHKNIAKVNLSEKGFEVNEHFEAAPNLFVMGPLLGGNMNKLIHFWHLENASRLMYLAPYLATELLRA